MAYRPGFRISQSSLPAADQIKSLIQRGMAVPDEGLTTRGLTHNRRSSKENDNSTQTLDHRSTSRFRVGNHQRSETPENGYPICLRNRHRGYKREL